MSLPVIVRASGLVAAMGLSACDSPSPAFSGITPRRVTVDGTTFAVRHTPFEAEAIRLNAAANPTRGEIVFKGAKAIMLASGCPVLPRTLEGDEAMVRASLECAGAGAPPPAADPSALTCGRVGHWRRDGIAWRSARISCVPRS